MFFELGRKESGRYPSLFTLHNLFSRLVFASRVTQQTIMPIRKGHHKTLQYRMQLIVTVVVR